MALHFRETKQLQKISESEAGGLELRRGQQNDNGEIIKTLLMGINY